jgi:Fe-S-cluster containining protein
MSCIKSGGKRCYECCRVVHINVHQAHNAFVTKKVNVTDGDILKRIWKPISRRKAKKINPYVVKGKKDMAYFTCKWLGSSGCSRYSERPDVCRRYKGDLSYSPTCLTDINIICRGG